MARQQKESETLVVRRPGRRRGHSGQPQHGSWKVAYADFVTAMMAFFLLLWLVNITDPDQKSAFAEYFNPYEAVDDSNEVEVEAGVISVFDGGKLGGDEVAAREIVDDTPESQFSAPPSALQEEDFGVEDWDRVEVDREEYEALLRKVELAELAKTEEGPGQALIDLELAMRAARAEEELEGIRVMLEGLRGSSPELQKYKDQISIEKRPDGVRIQIVDVDDFSMFRVGSAVLEPDAEAMIVEMGRALMEMDNSIAITGHTDGRPYRALSGYSNWELSSDRAQSARRAIVAGGVPEVRIDRVEGRAYTDPLLPEDPLDARNRRIDFFILR